ncbi:MAG: GatB/YqeY domain-containing protein [Patescibacteria group bacterium]|nr:GatB/YqeY domain-containing protein [Patescibacteria group bacterium]
MIKKKLQEKQIKALKAGEKVRLSTIRYILSRIKNEEIKKRCELSDDEGIFIIKKIIKELNESIEVFKKGKRDDLVEQAKAQLLVARSFLPPELTDDELREEIKKIIGDNQKILEQDKKAIISICFRQLRSKADSQRIVKILREYVDL